MRFFLLISLLAYAVAIVYLNNKESLVATQVEPGGSPPCDNPDSSALMAFYNATGGKNWINNSGWGDTCDICLWHGVICNSSGYYALQLNGNNLVGSIPASIGQLTRISTLSLSSNPMLIGSIPAEIGQLSTLNTLQIRNTAISGSLPPELGNLTNLQFLTLAANEFGGSLPVEIGDLTNLVILDISQNQLFGSIPTSIGNLKNVTTLSLFENQLSGALPSQIGGMTNLVNLQITSNLLSGAIPPEFGMLQNLRSANMGLNQFSELPDEIGDIQDLDWLSLASNQITSIPTTIGNLINLRALQLNDNLISGPIPPEIGNLQNATQVFLHDNKFSGPLPKELGDLFLTKFFGQLNISNNVLEGCIPSTFQHFCEKVVTFEYQNNRCLWQGDFSEFCSGIICNFSDYTLAADPGTNICAESTVELVATGGASYSWSNGETSSVISVSPTANSMYYLTVTTPAGCVRQDSILVTVTSTPTASGNSTDVTFSGGSDGTASITVTGGTPPYNYLWSTLETTVQITDLIAGAYYVTVTDDLACFDSISVVVNEPPCPTYGTPCDDTDPDTYDDQEDGNCHCAGIPCPVILLNDSQMNLDCHQDMRGSASVNPVGGQDPYSYYWSNGAMTSSIAALDTGSYRLTVTDANLCSVIMPFDITQPEILASNILGLDESAAAAMDGAADLSVTGGSSPYQYLWSNGATSEDISNLSGESVYYVTITDSHSCATQDSIIISTSCTPAGTICDDADQNTYHDREDGNCNCIGIPCPTIQPNDSQTNLRCHQDLTGTALVDPTGGEAPYSYLWSNGATTQSITNLDTGSCSVTITDANLCRAYVSFNLIQPPALISHIVGVNESNPIAKNGAADLSISGGSPPYQYLWSTGATSEDISSLSGDSVYYVTITDSNQCIQLDSTLISTDCFLAGTPCNDNDPTTHDDLEDGNCVCRGTPCPVISIGSIINSPDCFGLTGSIVTNVSGGVPPYVYGWSNGAFTPSILSVEAGKYTLTVADANGCLQVADLELDQPLSLTTTVENQSESSSGAMDGSANLVVEGGTQPYFYLWSNEETTKDIFDLQGGGQLYSVTVTDVKGCQAKASTVIETGCLPNGTSCDDMNIRTHTDQENGLCQCIGIPCPTFLPNAFFSPPTCFGSADGHIIINPTGGSSPYIASWADGSRGLTVDELASGSFTVTLTDGNGCQDDFTFQLVAPLELRVVLNARSESKPGAMDAMIEPAVEGGTEPYQYLWSNGATSRSLTNLVGAGSIYSITITDANNCQISESIQLQTNCLAAGTACDDGDSTTMSDYEDGNCNCIGFHCSSLQVNLSTKGITCAGSSDGTAAISPSGGNEPYQIIWSTGDGNIDTIESIAAGTYEVILEDASGCTADTFFNFIDPMPLTLTFEVVEESGPDQNDGQIDITVEGGASPYHFLWSNGQDREDLNMLEGDQTYAVTVFDNNGCSKVDSIWIPASCPASGTSCDDGDLQTYNDEENGRCQCVGTPCQAIAWEIEPVQPTCNRDSNGSLSILLNNGIGPFSFIWSTGDTSSWIDGLAVGDYRVSIADNNGCQWIKETNLSQPDPLALIKIVVAESAPGLGDGRIQIQVLGGIGPYDIVWSTDDTVSNINGLAGDEWYFVTATDAVECFISDSIFLASNPCDAVTMQEDIALKNIVLVHPTSCLKSDGRIQIQAKSNLALPLEFSIDGGGNWSSESEYRDLSVGRYSIFIRHPGDPCPVEYSADLGDPLPVKFESFDFAAPSACGLSDGYLSINGGDPSLYYSLNEGITWQKESSFSHLTSGKYQMSVRKVGDSCTTLFSKSFDLTRADDIAIKSIIITPSLECHGMDGSMTINPEDINDEYTYSLNGGDWQATNIFTNLEQNSYSLSIRTVTGCTLEWPELLKIEAPKLLDPSIVKVTDPTSCSQDDGSIDIEDTNTKNLEFSLNGSNIWSNNPSYNNLKAGTYGLLVRNALINCIDTLTLTLVGRAGSSLLAVERVISPSCAGGDDGNIEIQVASDETFQYLWHDGFEGNLRTQLSAGTYELTIIDGNDCSETHQYKLADPANLTLDLPQLDAMLFCLGDELSFTLSDTTYQYQWFFQNELIRKGPRFSSAKSGDYIVLAVDTFGCERIETFELNYSEQVFQANFLVPSEGVVNEPLIAVETSWPIPESIEWELARGEIIHQELNQATLEFSEPGTYLLRLHVSNGDCMSIVEKEITIVESAGQLGKQGPYFQTILSTLLSPNPNSGDFNLQVELNEPTDIQIRIYSREGLLVHTDQQSKVQLYRENIDLKDPIAGVYTVLVQTSQNWRSIHFAVN